jgi:5-methylcytosine-specific restriction endonuclease McrA
MASSDESVERCLDRAEEIVAVVDELQEESRGTNEWSDTLDEFIERVLAFKSAEKDLYASVLGESSGKGRIREFLKRHRGDVVTSEQLARVSGIKEYARRVRELRNEEGFVIDSTRTRADLGPHEYVLVEVRDVEKKSRITAETREAYLDEHGACERCGFDPSEHNEVVGEKRFLEVDHIEPFSEFSDSDAANAFENLQTLCNVCHDSKGTADNMWNRR